MPAPLGNYSRSFALDRAKADVEARTIEVSFSSEEPVDRYWGTEILDHTAAAVDLSRLNAAGPVLMDHDARNQIGVVERAWLDPKKKQGRATLRFSRSTRAEEIWNDVIDGIRRNVSVSYAIDRAEPQGEPLNGVQTYFVRSWTPSEISFVSCPADVTVGVGRSATPTNNPMPDNVLPVSESRSEAPGAAATERARIHDLTTVYEMHSCQEIDPGRVVLREYTATGRSVQELQKWILENRYLAQPLNLDPSVHGGMLGMNSREVKGYSLLRVLRALSERRPLDGIEGEASRAVAQTLRKEPEGVWIPNDVLTRQNPRQQRALVAGNASGAGYLVGNNNGGQSMIELLRNQMVIMELGARSLANLVGDIVIPRQTGGATAYWLPETAALTLSQQTFGQLTMTPKRVGASTAFSKQLLAQTGGDIEYLVQSDLMTVLALEKDRVALNGLGSSGEPLGILNTAGIGSVSFGGNQPNRFRALEFQTDVIASNAEMGSLAYLTHPTVAAAWAALPEVPNQAIYLWAGAVQKGTIAGRPALSTNQMVADKMIYGNWSDILVGEWGALDLVLDPYSLALQHQIQVVIHQMCDIAVRHVGSFSVSADSPAANLPWAA